MERYAHDVVELALRASRNALNESGCDAHDVTHLVTVSCTGFNAPGFDIELIRRLGLSPAVQRTHVGFMGCHGALNGLRVAKALVESEPAAVVLLCAAELCSLHFGYGWDNQRLVANSLFADGAAAAVVTSGEGRRSGERGGWSMIASGSWLVPDSADVMTWRIGDHGFEMTLSPRVPDLIEAHLPAWLDGWLARLSTSRSGVGSWIVHPGGPRILQRVESVLTLEPDALDVSRSVLNEHGNMSSPTVLFILDRLRGGSRVGPAVMLAFGPGLTIEAILLETATSGKRGTAD
jgi:predicted naringenin-chalcone synthase